MHCQLPTAVLLEVFPFHACFPLRQKSSSTLLGAITVDGKSSALMDDSNLKSEMGGERIFAYGNLSSEYAQRSLKVATIIMDKASIPLYMTGEGYNKTMSLAPCAVWLMKPGFEEKKAFFTSQFESKTMRFADAHGKEREVHLEIPFVEARKEASHLCHDSLANGMIYISLKTLLFFECVSECVSN